MSKKEIVYLLLDIILIVVSLSFAFLKEPMCALFAIAPMCSIFIILFNRKMEIQKNHKKSYVQMRLKLADST